jgi:hypothetical protein
MPFWIGSPRRGRLASCASAVAAPLNTGCHRHGRVAVPWQCGPFGVWRADYRQREASPCARPAEFTRTEAPQVRLRWPAGRLCSRRPARSSVLRGLYSGARALAQRAAAPAGSPPARHPSVRAANHRLPAPCRPMITCSICGARCSCKNARGGVCCGCHTHTVHDRQALRIAVDRGEQPTLIAPEGTDDDPPN